MRLIISLVLLLTASMMAAAPPAAAASACGDGLTFGEVCEVDLTGASSPVPVGTVPLDGQPVVFHTGAVTLTTAEGGSAGDLVVRVVDAAGEVVCVAILLIVPCQLPDTGQSGTVQVIPPDGADGTVNVYANSPADPQGCSAGRPDRWGAAGTAFSLDEPGSVACHRLTVEAGSFVVGSRRDMPETGLGTDVVLDAAGEVACAGLSELSLTDCGLAAGVHTVFATTTDGGETGRFTAYDLGSTAGCANLTPAFGGPGTAGRLGTGEWDCYRLQTTGGDPHLIFRALTDIEQEDVGVSVDIVDATGNAVCDLEHALLTIPCRPTAPGPWRALVHAFPVGGSPGDYHLALAQTDASRNGCRPHQLGTTTAAISLSSRASLQCHAFTVARGEVIGATLDEDGAGRIFAIGGDGGLTCDRDDPAASTSVLTGTCEVATIGPHAFVVVPAIDEYRLTSRCQDEEVCEIGEPVLAFVDPAVAGNTGRVTFTLSGRDLVPTGATLTGPGGTVQATVIGSDALGSRADAVFELDGQAPGAYDLTLTTAGGEIIVQVALVESIAPDIHVSISGPTTVRAGVPVTLDVVVRNEGNVDAQGVPIYVEVPADADATFPGLQLARPPRPPAFGEDFRWEDHDTFFENLNGPPVPEGEVGVSDNDMPHRTHVHPFVVPLVPANAEFSFPLQLVPVADANNSVQVTPGPCLLGETPAPTPGFSQTTGEFTEADCLWAIGRASLQLGATVAGLAPGGSCAVQAANSAVGFITSYNDVQSSTSTGTTVMALGDLSSAGLGIAQACVGELNPVTQVIGSVYDALKLGMSLAEVLDICLNLSRVSHHDLDTRASYDPNDITGPAGRGAPRAVRSGTEFAYRVRFENDAEQATAAAQTVTIDVPLHSSHDPGSIELTSFGFGDVRVNAFNAPLPFHHEVALSETQTADEMGELLVVVDAVLDGGSLRVTFDTRAPDGGAPGVLDGFLPPNEEAPEGEGQVTFAVASDAADGDAVTAQASIVFDANEPIVTNTWSNVIDDTPPDVTVATPALPEGSARATLTWSAVDSGAGPDHYDVEVSEDGGQTFDRLRTITRDTTVEHAAERGAQLAVRVRGTDRLGNQSDWVVSDTVAVADDAIDRLAGDGRVTTAIAISRATFDRAPAAVVVRADTYPDALAAAPLARLLDGPVLLTESHAINPAVLAELHRLGVARVVLVGGEGALSAAVADELARNAYSVERIAGANRFATAALIAARFPAGAGPVYVVEGANADPARGWPDALAIAPVAAVTARPLLLAARDSLPTDTADAITALDPTEAVIVGGPGAIGEGVEAAIVELAPTRRVFGADRYATALAAAEEGLAAGLSHETTWLATGLNFPDALAAGAAVAARGGTLLLIHGRAPAASQAVLDVLSERGGEIRLVRLVGGQMVITPTTAEAVRAALASG